ncbi:Isochorismatase hydrolase [Xylariomycetidae sp. FL2044]|nr:Isochorismatase hydrolase [Xylariomycetidae sp. FL2044]
MAEKEATPAPALRHKNPAILKANVRREGRHRSICDMQDKFRNAIWQFDKILLTAQKVLRAAQILKIPVYVTTQNAARLGGIVPELEPLTRDAVVSADKTYFSMMVPEVSSRFPSVRTDDDNDTSTSTSTSDSPQRPESHEVVIAGIESHICVTQTALDLLARGHRVYVLADGVSSCNEQEVPLALARLRAEGAVVTTSEGWLYECMGDAGIPEFRDVARLVKETSADTRTVLGALLRGKM